MMVICYANEVIEYDRRTPELSNSLPHMKQDNTSIEKYTHKNPKLRLRLGLTCPNRAPLSSFNGANPSNAHSSSECTRTV